MGGWVGGRSLPARQPSHGGILTMMGHSKITSCLRVLSAGLTALVIVVAIGCEAESLDPAERDAVEKTIDGYLHALAKSYSNLDVAPLEGWASPNEIAAVHSLLTSLAQTGDRVDSTLRGIPRRSRWRVSPAQRHRQGRGSVGRGPVQRLHRRRKGSDARFDSEHLDPAPARGRPVAGGWQGGRGKGDSGSPSRSGEFQLNRQPVVVIVGRPNVGKSTLFNRLTASRRALVHDLPGVTRDRIVGEALTSSDRRVTVIDTGGLLLGDEDRFVPLIRSQAEQAILDGDVVLFLLDGEAGPIPEDHEIAAYLRTLGVPVVAVVNKADRSGVELAAHEFHRLGLGAPVAVSAEHGTGMDGLWEAVEPILSDPEEGDEAEEAPQEGEIQVAIIGRPNVGKSSLLNRLIGVSRVLVSEVPGTTRDAIDVVMERDGDRYRFVDTAGIRRKGRTDRGPEVLSVVMARRHLERADVCLLVVDAEEGITRQDAHVAGYAWDAGRAVAIVVNKWDLVEDRGDARAQIEDSIARHLKFIRHSPVVFLSALTGLGVHKLFPIMGSLYAAHRARHATSDLNRILKTAWERRPPSMPGRTAPNLFYTTQVGSGPPRFVLFTNLKIEPHFSYLRYLENTLREALGLEGVPIRVMIKARPH